MGRSLLACFALAMAACAPAHLGTLSLSGERDMPTLLLGGWDGNRLLLFNELTIEPGRTTPKDVAQALSFLDAEKYAAIYFETAKLTPAMADPHSLFCPSAACIAVLERSGGDDFQHWGETVAVFEMRSLENLPIGPVWLNERAIRPPGPRRWSHLCKTKTDPPRFVHTDGGAIFPGTEVGKASFALFGPREAPAQYLAGFRAPSDTECDEEIVRLSKEPQPERPQIKADPSLMQK